MRNVTAYLRRDKMRKIALAAAVLLMAAAGTANAGTHKYTLVGADGTVYCDGLTVTTTDNLHYSGIHTGSCESGQAADGFATHIKGYVPVIDVATQYTGSTSTYTFLFSNQVLAWQLWTDESGVVTMINSGSLMKGAPPAAPHGISSSVKNANRPRAGEGLLGTSIQ
jgi:hypothetical protein